jgi:hypothetical protein
MINLKEDTDIPKMCQQFLNPVVIIADIRPELVWQPLRQDPNVLIRAVSFMEYIENTNIITLFMFDLVICDQSKMGEILEIAKRHQFNLAKGHVPVVIDGNVQVLPWQPRYNSKVKIFNFESLVRKYSQDKCTFFTAIFPQF